MWLLGAINGSDFIENPWNITFSTYTNYLGAGFYLIPIMFIAAALWLKTHNPMAVSTFIWVSSLFAVSGSIFIDFPEAVILFLIVTVIGLTSTIMIIVVNKFYSK